MRSPYPRFWRHSGPAIPAIALSAAILLSAPHACAQDTKEGQADPQEMAKRLVQMQQQLDAQQRQLDEYRDALKALQQQLQAATSANAPATANGDVTALQQAVTDLREEQSVQQSEIAVHEQAKVETRSRYNLRVGGLILFNAFADDGNVDSIDVPALALAKDPAASNGALGASLRQSLITFDLTGPRLWGARSYANVQMDFFGGLATSGYTSSAGSVRMRSAGLQMVWPTANVHAGLERLLIAPSSPTSYASIGEPALSWSGNLWAWVPQFAAEKTFAVGDRQFSIAAAFVDVPDPGPNGNQYLRDATAAEYSRFPGSEARLGYAWGRGQADPSIRANAIAVSGYWSPHSYGVYGSVDAWAGTADWRFALPGRLAFSGAAYKGAALGGLGGGAFKDVSAYSYYRGPGGPLVYKVVPLRNEGGWAQLKFHPVDWFEANGVFGQDNDSAHQLRYSHVSLANPYSGLARNQTFLGNVIFRPTNSFLLSLEYRKLRSWQLISPVNQAQIFGLAAGFEF
jgi:hypothetical protein